MRRDMNAVRRVVRDEGVAEAEGGMQQLCQEALGTAPATQPCQRSGVK